MKRPHPDLPRVTWDQAEVMNWWPAQTFNQLKISPGTVRRWASEGHIAPVAVGPGAIVLYRYEHVMGRYWKLHPPKDETVAGRSLQIGDRQ